MVESHSQITPPRAFTQGLGTVFQFAGVSLFLTMMFICCGSSLLSKETAMKNDLTHIGWGRSGGPANDPMVGTASQPIYSAQRAITLCVILGVFFGMAMAGIGLGLQAQRRHSPTLAALLSVFALCFWIVHTAFFATVMDSILLTFGCVALVAVFGVLTVLSITAMREMSRDPTPAGFELLPEDYKIPYSHLHQDPPEVRLARELELRRSNLEIQQKELQLLEEKLKRKMKPE